jgi:hypothetical protein
MTHRDDHTGDMTTLPDHVVALLAEADLADDPTVASLTVGLAALADVEAPTPTGELAALLDGTVRSLRGGGVARSATTAAAVTGVRAHWPTVDRVESQSVAVPVERPLVLARPDVLSRPGPADLPRSVVSSPGAAGSSTPTSASGAPITGGGGLPVSALSASAPDARGLVAGVPAPAPETHSPGTAVQGSGPGADVSLKASGVSGATAESPTATKGNTPPAPAVPKAPAMPAAPTMPTTPIAGLQGGANPDPGAKGNQAPKGPPGGKGKPSQSPASPPPATGQNGNGQDKGNRGNQNSQDNQGNQGNQGKAKKKGASPLAPLESDAPSAPLD